MTENRGVADFCASVRIVQQCIIFADMLYNFCNPKLRENPGRKVIKHPSLLWNTYSAVLLRYLRDKNIWFLVSFIKNEDCARLKQITETRLFERFDGLCLRWKIISQNHRMFGVGRDLCGSYDVKDLIATWNNIPLHFSDYVKQVIVVENVYSEDLWCHSGT